MDTLQQVQRLRDRIKELENEILKLTDIPKHETVEHWEIRTGETYPDNAPVYFKECCEDLKGKWYYWKLTEYKHSKPWASDSNLKKWLEMNKDNFIVANHNGKPEIDKESK